ncbi:UDP-2,3-diacylglucosamine diphosphatase [Mangrovicoccus algicola]|uniref:UDP-2,3-diacylglucosamine diphosphatase n=1 Tax=Mangrovicoccus algicola TaxID=2771008 RepID=A0A8J6YWV1_9RHOB|nr:UDP-2,3-diacylglucosamine diphosphatase [Mangrovicoccus algicola]MBE3637508.1 UDP-2,3-diacylglucosamine diphosphatase [Mangrovicoccus algicola]
MTPTAPLPGVPASCRTLFVSDIHLGTRGCQAGMFLDFLDHVEAERIYLVGDIFDGWRLRRGWHWPQPHNNVVEALLARAHEGVPVIYIPGNHDEVMRRYLGTHFGGIDVRDEDTHVTADGRRLLVVHGDKFDVVVMNARWLAHVGDWAYTVTLCANTWYNRVRRLWGGQYWSLSNWAKQSVKRAVSFIGEFEKVLADEAHRGGYDGIVCGHIHKAEMTRLGDVLYVNCGDWVESCTAIVEDHDGGLRLVDWADLVRERARAERDRARDARGEDRGGRRRKQKKSKKTKAAS